MNLRFARFNTSQNRLALSESSCYLKKVFQKSFIERFHLSAYFFIFFLGEISLTARTSKKKQQSNKRAIRDGSSFSMVTTHGVYKFDNTDYEISAKIVIKKNSSTIFPCISILSKSGTRILIELVSQLMTALDQKCLLPFADHYIIIIIKLLERK